LKFIFTNTLPSDTKGVYCHYHHLELRETGWQFLDIRPFVRENQSEISDEIGKWHTETSHLLSQHASWWWLHPHSRIVTFEPPVFYPFLTALSVIRLCEKLKEKEVHLVEFPIEVGGYLKELASDIEIVFRDKKPFLSGIRNNKYQFFIKNQVKFFMKLVILFFTSVFNFRKRLKQQQVQTIIYSHFTGIKNLQASEDHYFRNMFDNLVNVPRSEILWFYLSQNKKRAEIKALKEYMSRQNKPLVLVSDLIHPFHCLHMIQIHLCFSFKLLLLRNQIPLIAIQGKRSKQLTFQYYWQIIMGSSLFAELVIYFSTKRLFKSIRSKTLVYPYEEKGLERGLLRAHHETIHPSKCIAYAHAICNQGHLYIRYRPELAGALKPDLIAMTGPRMQKWYREWGQVDPQKMLVIGSSRFLPRSPRQSEKKTFKILFLGGLEHDLGTLSNFIREDLEIFKNCDLVIKIHPHDWQKAQSRYLTNIRSLGQKFTVDHRSLPKQFEECDLVLMCTTSAGIEAMLSGRPVICIDLLDLFNLNPFVGKTNMNELKYCYTASELKTEITSIRNLSSEEYNQLIETQTKVACEIYAPPNPTVISNMLKTGRVIVWLFFMISGFSI